MEFKEGRELRGCRRSLETWRLGMHGVCPLGGDEKPTITSALALQGVSCRCGMSFDFLRKLSVCNAKSAYHACVQVLYEEKQEERPTPPSPGTIELFNQVWKSKEIIPRVQNLAWRFLRKKLPRGARAGRFSKHIDKLCCRCGMQKMM